MQKVKYFIFDTSMMSPITVAEADQIILHNTGYFGVEDVPLMNATGRILAADIIADRDLPPYNRVTMDGIAISYLDYERGTRSFYVKATMAAGDIPISVDAVDQCIEIMTGCALPDGLDTVVRYEDITIEGLKATINTEHIKLGANIHYMGADKKMHDSIVAKNTVIDAVTISVAASVGLTTLSVKKLPKVVVISTGDELVDIHQLPTPYQIRRSNSYAIKATLQQYGIEADLLHVNDSSDVIEAEVMKCISTYDVIILSGGVSMGKFDYVPQALANAGIKQLFHKVLQKPGKPFWFGQNSEKNVVVFAFPGNPVSAFLCLHRYFISWLFASISHPSSASYFAVLEQDVTFRSPLQYFLQVYVYISSSGQLIATPVVGNGSGDFSSLIASNAFIELPAQKTDFKKGEVYKIIPFKTISVHG